MTVLHPENDRRRQRAERSRPATPRHETSRYWMSIADACTLLGVDQSTLRRWSDAGKVPVFRTPGGHRRYAEEDLLALLGQKGRRSTPAYAVPPLMPLGVVDGPVNGAADGLNGSAHGPAHARGAAGLTGKGAAGALPSRAHEILHHIAEVLNGVRGTPVDAAGFNRNAAMVRQAGLALGNVCAAAHHGAPEMVGALIDLRPRVPYGTPADHVAMAAVRQSETASHLLDQALISAVQAHADATIATLPPPFAPDPPVLGDA